ncbi:MAG: hypothetical protein N3D79_06565, partial [Acidilobaceae archaeon]|nr:hypothetical protein [Acidilobaceae archaeon]
MRLLHNKAMKLKYLTHALSRINDEVFMEVNKDGARFWLLSPDNESAEASYSLNALKVAAKPAMASKEIKISYATGHPMKMSFTIDGEEMLVIYGAPPAEHLTYSFHATVPGLPPYR